MSGYSFRTMSVSFLQLSNLVLQLLPSRHVFYIIDTIYWYIWLHIDMLIINTHAFKYWLNLRARLNMR